jgi:hypothetical protein
MQCNNVNCHAGKYSSGNAMAPFWNATGMIKPTANTVGACTKCHAMPPSGYSNHPAALSDNAAISTIYASCGSCHTNLSNTATNMTNVFSDKTKHINGTIDYVANCNGCHKYDVTGTNAWQNTSGTDLAHFKHITFIKNRIGYGALTVTSQTFGSSAENVAVCGTCHTMTLSQHNDGSKQITFGAGGAYPNTMGGGTASSMSLLFGGSNPSTPTFVSGSNVTCSNLMCHYATTPNWY